MRTFFKHPLFRIFFFGILLGAALLIVYGSKQPELEDRKVVINDADLAHMIAGWQRTWKRMPTKEELQGIMKSYVQDEVVYREALNQGLDQNNATVKRALISQMDMLAEGQGSERTISDEDIKAYYDLRKEQFTAPAMIRFHQVYFKNEKDSTALVSTVASWNQQQLAPSEGLERATPSLLPPRMNLQTTDAIDREFGNGFANALLPLPAKQWSGPVSSGFGLHVIYIDSVVAEAPLPLDKVKNEITNLLQYEEKQAAKEQFYTELLQTYEVIYQGMAKELVNE
ncbi:peptidyl-prolyl cis-trans isomerase [Robertkochia marina]|uniref:peptidylprolyl isomerase n=1 Tax=Robertkochia marina TaxID=1227945 RepID=A0A4S3LWY7_9FLAO|nr:peptidylprolyl isomerase [Robertkochia marina]THD65696.1 peptidyl-prolyl cis-trans isomerase [Robertkochia marina]TRZ46620.1 peptidyl-prolyl cis-trans isomerase [Robertkochia marina]